MSCCPTEVLPVKASYDRHGDNFYIVGSGSKGIVYIPDIFGSSPQAYMGADLLAGKGFLVCMPDFFRDKPWRLDDLPPKDPEAFQAFLGALTYDALKDRVERGITLLKALGASSIGSVGFCWGGNLAIRALVDGSVRAAASPHPSVRGLTADVAKDVKGPFCLMPSKDDGPMDDVRAALNPEFAAGHEYRYFDDMHHGFMGARADYTNEANRARANEGFEMLAAFFARNL